MDLVQVQTGQVYFLERLLGCQPTGSQEFLSERAGQEKKRKKLHNPMPGWLLHQRLRYNSLSYKSIHFLKNDFESIFLARNIVPEELE